MGTGLGSRRDCQPSELLGKGWAQELEGADWGRGAAGRRSVGQARLSVPHAETEATRTLACRSLGYTLGPVSEGAL